MKRTQNNLQVLSMLSATALVVGNVVTGKLIDTHIPLFGSTILIGGSIICFTVSMVITNIVNELFGKERADSLVTFGAVAQIAASLMIFLTQKIPAVDAEMQQAYDMLLGQNWIFVAGSLSAYWISRKFEVFIFDKMKRWSLAKSESTRARWIWNLAASATGQIIDTVIFTTIAFGIGMRFLFSEDTIGTLLAMIVGQYLVKLLLAALDTPIFYLLTRKDES